MAQTAAPLPASLPSSRLKSIDFLRGCAALAVMVGHAVNYGDRLPEGGAWFQALHKILDHGHLGVPLFFVISGFCIHLRWAKQYRKTGETRLDFAHFWRRRIRRLYPPYLVMLVLSMALVVIAYKLNKAVPLVTLYPDPKPQWMIWDFLAHVTMLHGLHPVFNKAGGNPPFWTLAREEYFYILYFGLLAWRCRWGLWSSMLAVLLLGLALPIALRPWVPVTSEWWLIIRTSALVLWFQWCLGMVAVEAYYGVVKLPRWCSSVWMLVVWTAAALWCGTHYSVLAPPLWGMVFFTLVNYCVEVEIAARWPSHALVNWLCGVGVFSYSLYLVHYPVRGIVKQFLGPLATTSDPFLYLFATLLISIACFFAAKVFFALVESRFLNTPSGDTKPEKVAAPIIAASATAVSAMATPLAAEGLKGQSGLPRSVETPLTESPAPRDES